MKVEVTNHTIHTYEKRKKNEEDEKKPENSLKLCVECGESVDFYFFDASWVMPCVL